MSASSSSPSSKRPAGITIPTQSPNSAISPLAASSHTGQQPAAAPGKRADYLLRYTRDLPLAVVEAKAAYKHPADGLQQAKDYATILGLPFAYATNGTAILEFDFLTGTERELADFPIPADLWARYSQKTQQTTPSLLTP